jgi:hypothetical protein
VDLITLNTQGNEEMMILRSSNILFRDLGKFNGTSNNLYGISYGEGVHFCLLSMALPTVQ